MERGKLSIIKFWLLQLKAQNSATKKCMRSTSVFTARVMTIVRWFQKVQAESMLTFRLRAHRLSPIENIILIIILYIPYLQIIF